MVKQVLKMEHKGCYVVVEHHEGKLNPYRICVKWYEMDADGFTHERRKQVAKYADMKSCVYHIAQCI